MTQRDDLAALRLVARMRLDLAQGRMAALRRKDDAVGETLAALDQSRTTRTTALEENRGDAALQAGQDMVWHRWIDGRRAALNAERLSLMRQQDQMRADLARQFGRKEAIDQLHRDAADQAQKDRQRRADRSG